MTVAEEFVELFSRSTIVDLAHALEEGIPTYPTHTKFFQNQWLSMGDVARMNQLVIGEHTGTHVDSPSHFPISGSSSGVAMESIALDTLIGRCVTIRLPESMEANQMHGPEHLQRWEASHGDVLPGDIVLLDFQWAATRWLLGEDGFANLQGWPGIDKEFAEALRDRGAKVVGTDCISLDSADGGRGALPAHFTLLEAGVLIMENLANLHLLPPVSFFMALPLKIKNGTGSPIRAVALVER